MKDRAMIEYVWLAVIVGGPAILGLFLAYGMMQKRRLTDRERRARDRATDRLYREGENGE
jgi:heme exporter protein D